MAKKKQPLAHKALGFGAKNLTTELHKAEALMVRQKWAEAREILNDLSQTYPQQTDVLGHLVNVCYELQDIPAYERACERLLQADPKNADATFGLAGAYLTNLHPLLALQTFRQALDRWPNHEKAKEARKIVADLEANIDNLLADINVTGEAGLELAILHERGQAYLEQGEYQKAKQTEEVLRRNPAFVSARNNLSLISFLEGNMNEAIAISQLKPKHGMSGRKKSRHSVI